MGNKLISKILDNKELGVNTDFTSTDVGTLTSVDFPDFTDLIIYDTMMTDHFNGLLIGRDNNGTGDITILTTSDGWETYIIAGDVDLSSNNVNAHKDINGNPTTAGWTNCPSINIDQTTHGWSEFVPSTMGVIKITRNKDDRFSDDNRIYITGLIFGHILRSMDFGKTFDYVTPTFDTTTGSYLAWWLDRYGDSINITSDTISKQNGDVYSLQSIGWFEIDGDFDGYGILNRNKRDTTSTTPVVSDTNWVWKTSDGGNTFILFRDLYQIRIPNYSRTDQYFIGDGGRKTVTWGLRNTDSVSDFDDCCTGDHYGLFSGLGSELDAFREKDTPTHLQLYFNASSAHSLYLYVTMYGSGWYALRLNLSSLNSNISNSRCHTAMYDGTQMGLTFNLPLLLNNDGIVPNKPFKLGTPINERCGDYDGFVCRNRESYIVTDGEPTGTSDEIYKVDTNNNFLYPPLVMGVGENIQSVISFIDPSSVSTPKGELVVQTTTNTYYVDDFIGTKELLDIQTGGNTAYSLNTSVRAGVSVKFGSPWVTTFYEGIIDDGNGNFGLAELSCDGKQSLRTGTVRWTTVNLYGVLGDVIELDDGKCYDVGRSSTTAANNAQKENIFLSDVTTNFGTRDVTGNKLSCLQCEFCPTTTIDSFGEVISDIEVSSIFTELTQECCEGAGYTWSGNRCWVDSTSYCNSLEIFEDGDELISATLNDTPPQDCCEGNGGTFIDGKCYSVIPCESVNLIEVDGTLVDETSGQIPSQGCCESNGYYYEGGQCLTQPTVVTIGVNETPIEGCGESTVVSLFLNLGSTYQLGESISQLDFPVSGELVIRNLSGTKLSTSVIGFNSTTDGLDTFVRLESTVDTNNQFNISVEFTGLLGGGIRYDIYIDDVDVSCSGTEEIIEYTVDKCPGFELERVIDNKKSWVYNSGETVNRLFAPSSDAEIPYRTTDYTETHSKLVLNSKEMDLTFNVCPPATCDTNLTVLQLKDFKDTFQKFWVKFIEQFVPATTIWSGDEKWCNPEDVVNDALPDVPSEESGETEDTDDPSDTNLDGGTKAVDGERTKAVAYVPLRSEKVVLSETSGDYTTETQGMFVSEAYVAYLIPSESGTTSSDITLDEELLLDGTNDFSPTTEELIIEP